MCMYIYIHIYTCIPTTLLYRNAGKLQHGTAWYRVPLTIPLKFRASDLDFLTPILGKSLEQLSSKRDRNDKTQTTINDNNSSSSNNNPRPTKAKAIHNQPEETRPEPNLDDYMSSSAALISQEFEF